MPNPPDAGVSETEQLVLDTIKASISEEFQIAERFDAKARSYLQLGGIWFAVVQAVAIPLIPVLKVAHRWILGLIIIGAVAAVTLAVATWFTSAFSRSERRRRTSPRRANA